jgi:hypothetical protein
VDKNLGQAHLLEQTGPREVHGLGNHHTERHGLRVL